MNTATKTKRATLSRSHATSPTHKRLSVWERARGIWKGRTPDPIQELALMRKEMNRTMHATSRPK